jgi:uncharacterized protein YbaR (Trm112 family)
MEVPSPNPVPAAPLLDPEFVKMLRCPACADRPPLRLDAADGALHCDRCGRAYPVSPEGIPLLDPDSPDVAREKKEK